MARPTLADLARLAIVEVVVRRGSCAYIDDIVDVVERLAREYGVSACRCNIRNVVSSIVSRYGPLLGACWAPGEPRKVCRCG